MPLTKADHTMNGVGVSTADLSALLELCRSDLDSARREAVGFGPAKIRRGGATVPEPSTAAERTSDSDLEARLDRVAAQLDRAAGALSQLASLAQRNIVAAGQIMAQEADHRIKNSLQILASLLKRQGALSNEAAVRDALDVASARITAFATVHTVLHQGAGQPAMGAEPMRAGTSVGLAEYVTRLCDYLRDAFGFDATARVLAVDMQELAVAPETVRTVGLIVTELVTNAARHALPPGRAGTVRIAGHMAGAKGVYLLTVENDGIPLPSGFDIRLRPSGLGLRLVCLLADQLRARLTVERAGGACFTLALPCAGTVSPA